MENDQSTKRWFITDQSTSVSREVRDPAWLLTEMELSTNHWAFAAAVGTGKNLGLSQIFWFLNFWVQIKGPVQGNIDSGASFPWDVLKLEREYKNEQKVSTSKTWHAKSKDHLETFRHANYETIWRHWTQRLFGFLKYSWRRHISMWIR